MSAPQPSASATDPASLARAIRRTVIEQSKRAHVGHIGSSLSIADLLAALLGGAMELRADPADRDRLILSKGHAALGLYAALHATGRLADDDLRAFCGDGTALGVHPEHALGPVDFSTGSLGHGLSLGVGATLAAARDGSARRTYVLMSDAECNEGSVWEAVMFASQHRLGGLTVIVDVNGQQAFGKTRDVIDLAPLDAKFSAFGWEVAETEGHDPVALVRLLRGLDPKGPPHVVLAQTTFGKGVTYMEGQLKWHYWPMSDDEYELALADLEAAR